MPKIKSGSPLHIADARTPETLDVLRKRLARAEFKYRIQQEMTRIYSETCMRMLAATKPDTARGKLAEELREQTETAMAELTEQMRAEQGDLFKSAPQEDEDAIW